MKQLARTAGHGMRCILLSLTIVIAGALLPGNALAQNVVWINLPTSPASLAPGEGFTPPSMYQSLNGPRVASIRVDIVGGCGTFPGGASSAEVTFVSDGTGWIGTPPRFTATAPGTCDLKFVSSQTNTFRIHVYNPQTLRLQPVHPLVAVKTEDTSYEVGARVVDDAGRPATGKTVRYTWQNGGCGGLVSGFDRYEVKSKDSGIAIDVAFAAKATAGFCPLSAMLVENGTSISIPTLIFQQGLATVRFAPVRLTAVLNSSISFEAQVVDAEGRALPRLVGKFSANTPSGSAGISLNPSSTITDGEGKIKARGTTNAIAGSYDIVFSALGRSFRLPIEQAPASSQPVAPTASLQDMWWGGVAQDGWGVSIVQHGAKLFSVIYAYGADGAAEWYVMPEGSWDATGTRYSGRLYTPRGTPFFDYDASRLAVGMPIGDAMLTFNGNLNATLDYSVRGAAGRKDIVRNNFGGFGDAPRSGLTDMWWGGEEENGWGVAIIQHGYVLFGVWFTYDETGRATWFTMPTGVWEGTNLYKGRIYKTQGSQWAGVEYDPRLFRATDVGSFRLDFGDGSFFYEVSGRSGTLPLKRQSF